MVIIELTYKKPLSEIDKHLEEHRALLQKYYDKGVLLASGHQQPRTGGIIIGLTDQETMEALMKEDPFYQHDLADYRFIQFNPVKCSAEVRAMLDKVGL